MAIIEFHCKKCDTEYEELVRKVEDGKYFIYDDGCDGCYRSTQNYIEVACPKCKSTSKRRLNSTLAPRVNQESHDYKFNAAQPKLRE